MSNDSSPSDGGQSSEAMAAAKAFFKLLASDTRTPLQRYHAYTEELADWDRDDINACLSDCGQEPLSPNQLNDLKRLRELALTAIPVYPQNARGELDEFIGKRILFRRRSIPPPCLPAWAVASAFIETVKRFVYPYVDECRVLAWQARKIDRGLEAIGDLLKAPRLTNEALDKLKEAATLLQQIRADLDNLAPQLRRPVGRAGYKEFGIIVALCAELYTKQYGRRPTVSHSTENKPTGPFVEFVEQFVAPHAPRRPCSWWPATPDSRAHKIDNVLKEKPQHPPERRHKGKISSDR